MTGRPRGRLLPGVACALMAGTLGCDLVLDTPDQHPPQVRITEPTGRQAEVTASEVVRVEGMAVDDHRVERVTLVLDDRELDAGVRPGRATPFGVTTRIATLGDTIEIRAYDAAGNRGSARIPTPIHDSEAPDITLLWLPYTPWGDGRFRMAGRATDEHGVESVRVRQNSNVLARLPATFDTVLAASGPRAEIVVEAYDRVGNTARRTYALQVDTTPPMIRAEFRPYALAAGEAYHRVRASDNTASERSPGLASFVALYGGSATSLGMGPYPELVRTLAIPGVHGAAKFVAEDRLGHTASDSSSWVQIEMTAVTSAGQHTCALSATGAAYCVGPDGAGQLGDGPGSDGSSELVEVAGGHTFGVLRAGPYTTCGVDTAGRAFCWGANWAGQVGDGTQVDRHTPAPVDGGLTFLDVQPGWGWTCGLEVGGTAYCWGRLQRPGPDSTAVEETTLTPRAIAAPTPFVALFTHPAADHACATDAAGAVYCWGRRLGYDPAAPRDALDTLAVLVDPGPFSLVQPLPDGEWLSQADPWTLAVTVGGKPVTLGGARSWTGTVSALPALPYRQIVAAAGWYCLVAEGGTEGCPESDSDRVGPRRAEQDAAQFDLDVAAYTVSPCFLTPAGSLYCRRRDG